MSTKTTFKRIALVAVSAVGLGLISAVPAAQAVVGTPSVTVTDGTATTASNYDSTSGATIAISANFPASTDSIIVTVFANTVPAGAVTNTPSLRFMETSTSYAIRGFVDTNPASQWDSSTAASSVAAGDTVTSAGAFRMHTRGVAGASYAKFRLEMDSGVARTAGTYSYTIQLVYNGASAGSAVTSQYTANIVVGLRTEDSLTASPTYSTAVLQLGTSASGTTVDSVVAIPSYAATSDSASILVTLKNASATTAARESVTVTTSLGLVGASGQSYGKSVVLAYSSTSLTIGIRGDGVAGAAVITVSTPSVKFGTKNVTFYSTSVSKIVGTKRLNTMAIGTNSAAITAVATDASGNQNGLSTAVYAYSSDTTIVSDYGTACAYSAANARQECTLTGVKDGTVTITLRDKSTVALSTVADAATYSVTVSSAAPVALKMELVKSTLAPNEKTYLKVWAVDSAGKPVAPQTLSNFYYGSLISTSAQLGSSSTGLTSLSSVALAQKTAAVDGFESLEPVASYTIYAPAQGGKFTLTAVGGALFPASGQVAVTVTGTVADSASDALAAVTALASQVSAFITKINAQITTLTDLVMKIQKKVKA